MTELTSVGWTVEGVSLTPSDLLYERLVEAITDDKLSPGYLRKISRKLVPTKAALAPIKVSKDRKHIQFGTF